jgi:hypothetical protein
MFFLLHFRSAMLLTGNEGGERLVVIICNLHNASHRIARTPPSLQTKRVQFTRGILCAQVPLVFTKSKPANFINSLFPISPQLSAIPHAKWNIDGSQRPSPDLPNTTGSRAYRCAICDTFHIEKKPILNVRLLFHRSGTHLGLRVIRRFTGSKYLSPE